MGAALEQQVAGNVEGPGHGAEQHSPVTEVARHDPRPQRPELGDPAGDRVAQHVEVLGRAPLEERVGGGAIGLRGRAVGGAGDAASVFALARTDAAARAFVEERLDDLAVHVTNAAILVDPARITIGGGLIGSADIVLPALKAVLDRAVPFPPELLTARFAQDGPLVGAAALAWDAVTAA